MVRDFLSAWAARYAATPRAEFAAAFPQPFLVWEPGPWQPRGLGETSRPAFVAQPAEPAKQAERAVVIPLRAGRLVLGRAPECEVPINDASLSRKHLAFTLGPGPATVEELGSRNGSWLEGVKLTPLEPTPLAPGARLLAGAIHLSFLDAEGLHLRLRQG